MTREFTSEDLEAKLLAYIVQAVQDIGSSSKDPQQACNNLAVTIMGGLLGHSNKLPMLVLSPCPHKDDKAFFIANHADGYWPMNQKGKGAISDPLFLERLKKALTV